MTDGLASLAMADSYQQRTVQQDELDSLTAEGWEIEGSEVVTVYHLKKTVERRDPRFDHLRTPPNVT